MLSFQGDSMKLLLLVSLLVLSACSSLPALEQQHNIRDDYAVAFAALLSVDEQRHNYVDSQGITQTDHLKLFKELERVYINAFTPDLENNTFSPDRLKLAIFFAFYAEQRNSSALQEYLATDLMPIYLSNRADFLTALDELPFLITANCDRLNVYFGFEGKNTSGQQKQRFIQQNTPLFDQYLGPKHKQQCLALFNQ